MNKPCLALAMATALLGGCASTVVPTDQARLVPSAQLLPGHRLDLPDKVLVKRNDVFTGSACPWRVYADGKPIADLWRGEKVLFALPPGRRILSADIQGICPGQIREITVELGDGRQRVFLLDAGLNAELVFQETAF